MKVYWDSSALIAALQSPAIRREVKRGSAITRSHSFSEIFSTLTGGRLGFRCDAEDVNRMLRELSEELEVCDLSFEQTLHWMEQSKAKGIRGGAIYDFLHACTAVEFGCDSLCTLNRSDFAGLFEQLVIEEP